MVRKLLRSSVRWGVSALLLGLVVFLYRTVLPVNPTTVAVTFLLLILVLAAYWGLRYAVATSIAATLCFNYYFLPPLNTFVIAERQNWVALLAFCATALIGSNLSDRIHQQAEDAERSRDELACLYDFGQRLLATGTSLELLRAVPVSIVSAFRSRAAALYLVEGDRLYLAGPERDAQRVSRDVLHGAVHGSVREFGVHAALLPVSVGVRPIGSIYVESLPDGELPARATLEAMTALIALSIERTGAVDKLARSDAARESEELRSAVLDAVTHDLRTPLTSIKAAVTALQHEVLLTPAARAELLTIIDEESDRLNHLIAQATEMASLEASQVKLDLASCLVTTLAEEAIARSSEVLKNRPVRVQIAENLPPVRADALLIGKVLKHLIENAAKYATPAQPIYVAAAEKAGFVTISVADLGPGIDPAEQALIFEKFYRGRSQRYRSPGTGMGLAICRVIMEAHGGAIRLTSEVGKGSTFALTLPVALTSMRFPA